MVEVKMENARNVEFHAVHRVEKQRDDGKPRAIIVRFVNRKTNNDLWRRRKELANSSSHKHIDLVPDYAYETAKEQRKLSNALRNAIYLYPLLLASRNVCVIYLSYSLLTIK